MEKWNDFLMVIQNIVSQSEKENGQVGVKDVVEEKDYC